MKVQSPYKYLSLLLFVLIINFFSCADDKFRKYDMTVDYVVSVYMNEGFELERVGEYSGKLNVEDLDGQKIEFNIKTGDNEIEIPFGFYRAIVNGFENCSFAEFELLALGGNQVMNTNIAISVIPDFNVEILSIQPTSFGEYELLFQADTPDSIYNFKLWGSNEEDSSDREIIQLQWRSMWIYNGQGRFYIDGDYKYYCLTAEPFSGFRDNSECKNWFEFIQD